ncbi:hypothetical protein [Nodularia chucula]|uniref:hypothetical protein n=1 Tax=Nodularia chucula TaxID=3093667 RepID=UPI0039C6D3E0
MVIFVYIFGKALPKNWVLALFSCTDVAISSKLFYAAKVTAGVAIAIKTLIFFVNRDIDQIR